MRKKTLCIITMAALLLCGCGNNKKDEAVVDEQTQASESAVEQEAAEQTDVDEGYVIPEGVVVSEAYERSAKRVPIKQIVEDCYDSEYIQLTVDSHAIYAAEKDGCDIQDQVTVIIDAANPSDFFPQKITKTVIYMHNTSNDEWTMEKASLKRWDVNDGKKFKLNKTAWMQHLDDASSVNEKLFLDSEKTLIIPTTEAGKAADLYVYFKDDFSFFNVRVDPTAENTNEVIFYTEGSAVLYFVYEGNVYEKQIHFVEGTIDDKGVFRVKPEDGDEYFELLPAMTQISDDEYKAAVGIE